MRIVFFDIDCLRPDHLGCSGYDRPTSPNIDKIAQEGIRFTHYYCASSPCQPSRTEWISGRFGTRNGVVSNVGAGSRFHIRTLSYGGPEPANDTLMRRLRTAGCYPVSFSNFADRHSAWYFMSGWSEFHTPNLKGGAETADEVHEPLLQWLKANAAREDYLLHINYWDAHRPYKMAGSWADRFAEHPVPQDWPDDEAIGRHQSITGPFTAHSQFPDDISPYELMPGAVNDRADFEHLVTGYDAAIAYVDHHIGIVLEELDRQGALDDCAVIISADHGDNFGEHGVYSDHVCADEAVHHIPLIVKWPGVTTANATCDSMLYNVDLPPTLCDLLGAEPPEDWDGVSFAPQLRGKEGPERDHLVWGHALYSVQRAVRTRSHLMLRTYDSMGYPFDEIELYDIAKDPYQTRNVRDDQPGVVQELCELLGSWVDEQLSRPNSIPDPFEAVLKERSAAGRA